MFDALYPPGLQWYWRADFVNELSDSAIAQHIKYGSEVPTLHSTMHLFPINGAAHHVGKQDTAWSYRDATLGTGCCWGRSRASQQRQDHRVDEGMGGIASLFSGWRVCEFSDG